MEPEELPAGSLVGKFHSVQEEDVEPALETADEAHRIPTRDGRGPVPEHVAELYRNACDGGESKRERLVMAQLLSEYKDVFSCGDHDMGLTEAVCHEIPLAVGMVPIRQPTHRLGLEKERKVSQQVQDLLSRDLIGPGHGAWSSPVVLVWKKDGSWRFCVDYCRLNSVTIQDAYPLSRIDELLEALAGSKFFSTLALLSGCWQVPLSPEAQDKAAFILWDGLWKLEGVAVRTYVRSGHWKVLPFELTSAPATFQRLMEQVLSGLHWKTLLIYLDVIVISPDFGTHVSWLREVFDRLRAAGLKLKPSRCALLQREIKYLGYVVGRDGVATNPEKVRAVRDWAVPVDLPELRAFLGLVGYYHQYIPDFVGIAQPLNRLTAKGVCWQWT